MGSVNIPLRAVHMFKAPCFAGDIYLAVNSYKVKARRIGHGRFPNRVLYERCGLYKLSNDSSLEDGVCVGKKNIGKPYARFDEGGLVMVSMDWLLRHRLTKEAGTDRLIPNDAGARPLLYPFIGMAAAIQYRPAKHGHRRNHAIPETGYGSIILLLSAPINGRITTSIVINLDPAIH